MKIPGIISLDHSEIVNSFFEKLESSSNLYRFKKIVGIRPIEKYDSNTRLTVPQIHKEFGISKEELYGAIHSNEIDYLVIPGSELRPSFRILYKDLVKYQERLYRKK